MVPEGPSKGQGHLLSCCGQLKSDWETVEDSDGCENDFPAIDVSCDNWDKKFNEKCQEVSQHC